MAVVFTIGVITIWQIFTTLKTLAEAQQFSAWRALANLILTGLLVAVVIVLIAVLVGLAAGLFERAF